MSNNILPDVHFHVRCAFCYNTGMKVGAFELDEPLPELRKPCALAMLSPWIDVGQVGSLTLSVLENHFKAQALGRLIRPGLFYDFTRYRPIVHRTEERREVKIPNTFINYARGEGENDFLFFHCMEPHLLGETYADSVVKVLEKLKVKSYHLMGAMYDTIPHTRPLPITGTASDEMLESQIRELKVTPSTYQGPTTINLLVSEQALRLGVESLTSIVHLPNYAQLEEDYKGQHALLSLICSLYGLSLDLSKLEKKGEKQYKRIGIAIEMNPKVKELIEKMEREYDSRPVEETTPTPPLSPELEKFLSEMDKRFDPDQ
ncbi:PAC2 family protein [Chloroflexota bacterium]